MPQNFVWLVLIVLLGAILRFWNLDLKPLWLDETITALFSLGHTYSEVPLGQVQPLADLFRLFQWQPASCIAISAAIRAQSTHPPLFFCWLHQWLGWVDRFDMSLAWKLRSLPAFLGILAIPAVYRLNRVAFSPSAGLAAATLMAVSPFAVYLSQEARHYTLPMLLIILSLVGLVLMLQDLCERQAINLGVWMGWSLLNGLGLYTHYFFALAATAQVLTLLSLSWMYRARLPRRVWGVIGLAIATILLIDAPLLPQFFEHLQRPATDWLNLTTAGLNRWTPLLRFTASLVIMTVIFPVEQQPLGITIVSGLAILSLTAGLGWRVFRGLQRLWRSAATHFSLLLLAHLLGWLLLEYFIVVYGLGKDLTLAFRYNFMLYPLVCALIGAGLTAPSDLEWKRSQPANFQARAQGIRRDLPLVTLVGLLSSACVVSGLAFLKPFQPQQIVQRLQTSTPILVTQTYENWQSVAFGLSIAVNSPATQQSTWLFQSSPIMIDIEEQAQAPLIWLFSDLTDQKPLPSALKISSSPTKLTTNCPAVGEQHQAMNVRYQSYRCIPQKPTR
ncbi:hypothetical protein C1752_05030 [Acaryochloris thomasi RCC1774]|uniref:Glycosyltransferase RgtA/B/C/D-like domain-containing protein n=1 Tax=Acaryochloris thomasi RCC1774 TaxID=1764569 RepID=A0A2W1JCA8_9CYAN|nr:glycosyltransferase family 39 protein [Acaryochloris thomasi]PZD71603.1 hypothetical protein C1752_05030 [Acaryochloris thomasi RCC1774]